MTQIPGAQLSPRERGRCSEVIWAQFGGYERCHRNKGHEPLPHHVRDARSAHHLQYQHAENRGVTPGCDRHPARYRHPDPVALDPWTGIFRLTSVIGWIWAERAYPPFWAGSGLGRRGAGLSA